MALLAASFTACSEDGRGGSERAGGTGPATTASAARDTTSPSASFTVPSRPSLTTIEEVSYPDALALAGGAAWVLQVEQDEVGTRQSVAVVRVDADDHLADDPLEIESLEGDFLGAAITAGAGAVWVATSICNGERPTLLFRIDPATAEVSEPVDVGKQAHCEGLALAAGPEKVWAGGLGRDQTSAFVREVDAASLAVGALREIPGPTVEHPAPRVMATTGLVWVSARGETVVHAATDWSEIARLDHETLAVVEHAGALWAGAEDGVHRYEGEPPVETALAELPDPAPGHPQHAEMLAASEAGLWVQGLAPVGHTTLHEIDPATNTAGPDLLPDQFWLLGADYDGLWLQGPPSEGFLQFGMPSPVGRIEGPYPVADVDRVADVMIDDTGRPWLLEWRYQPDGPLLRRVSGDPPAIDLEVDLGDRWPIALTAGDGAAWALTVGGPASTTEPVEGPLGLVAVDPDTGDAGEPRLFGGAARAWDSGGAALVVAHGDLWMLLPPEGGGTETLLRIDPDTAREVGRISLPTTGAGLTFDDGELWLIDSRAIRRIDPDTADLTDVVELEWLEAGVESSGFASNGSLWVTRREFDAAPADAVELRRIDPASGETFATYELGSGGGVVATDRFAWIGGNRVSLIDLASGEVRSITSTFEVAWYPFAADDEGAWFTGVNRGGPTGLARARLPEDLAG